MIMGGIYIHIPFCHSKCYYCDFFSRPCRHTDRVTYQNYTTALIAEWALRRNELSEPVSTIYIGGGTPSSMPVEFLEQLAEALPTDNVTEFTVEANPEDITPQWASAIKRAGVNRVSMGAQSIIASELKAVGRRHTPAQTVEAFNLLRRAGIDNISLDLIYGLPLQTPDSWQQSLDSVLELRPEHLSAYSLTYEEGTRLNAMRLAGKVTPAPDETVELMYSMLCSATSGAGYTHYEISNFALPGKHARHNSSYWDFTPYVGLGVAAHSFDGARTRRANPADINAYIDSINHNKLFCTVETESVQDLYNDYIITHLRTLHGLDPEDIHRRFGTVFAERFKAACAPHILAGRIEESHGRRRISPQSWLISDAVLRDIIVCE